MRKLMAVMNMTLDGFCDHTAGIADDETHQHYTELLRSADAVIYGRITFQLMEFWPPLVAKPSGHKALDDFAVAIDQIHKIVYSRTLTSVEWHNTELKREINKQELIEFKQQAGRDILVGSPSMIVAMTQLGLIDEFQLMIHPMIVGSGQRLFKNINERVNLKLIKTKTFSCGAIATTYRPVSN